MLCLSITRHELTQVTLNELDTVELLDLFVSDRMKVCVHMLP